MLNFILKRTGSLAFTVLGMSLLMFLISRTLPGDPARAAAGGIDASVEMVQHTIKEYGLDKPLIIQYFIYMKHLLRGDFGRSLVTRRPIIEDLKIFYPATFELTFYGILFACVVGIPLGILSAIRRGKWIDHLSRVASLFMVAMPLFWLGLMAIFIFYAKLGLFPGGGRLSYDLVTVRTITGILTLDAILLRDFELFKDAVYHLILPMIILSSISLGIIARMTRSCMLEVMGENYIITARAKGLTERGVIMKHALRNAVIPVITVVGLQFGILMGGAVITETVFSWPGVGRYAILSVDNKDFPAIMGFAISFSFLYAIINLIIDILYAFINPKISY
ncbi:MAG: peptide ABC transporter permease [Deltaproteobacteria bacterium RBG_16_47_11]|nr:MAG: peptide ABC transporter permease [Deltaproteobacteria bacterium RBG_16_47_11]